MKLNKTTLKYKQTSHYLSLFFGGGGGEGIRIKKKQTNKQTKC